MSVHSSTLSMAADCLVILSLILAGLAGMHPGLVMGGFPLGSRLRAGEEQAWVSENGTFAFGFAPMDSGDEMQLGIWYARLPGHPTLVWSANRNSPVGRGAVLLLDATGNLLLTYRQSPVWMSNTSGMGVDSALLSDSGNLVLQNSSHYPLWQSFSHPSDTLLPGQPLTVSLELTTPDSNSHVGYYSLKMLQQPTSLSLALTYNLPQSDADSSPPQASNSNYSYWSSPEISNATGDVVALLDEGGNFIITYGSSPSGTVFVHKNDAADGSGSSRRQETVLRRITIEMNGNLRFYRWNDGINGSHQWVADWAAVSSPCNIAGICGSGFCSLSGSRSNVTCAYPPGNSNSTAILNGGGCLSNSSPPLPGDCSAPTSAFKIVTMQQTNYYFSEASVITNYSDISTGPKCEESCLSDCECVGSVYGLSDEKTYCWTLRSMVFGGFQDPSSTLFVKVGINSTVTREIPRGSLGDPESGDPNANHKKVVVIPIVLCMSVIIAFLCFLLHHSLSKNKAKLGAVDGYLMVPGAPQHFSYRDLQLATSNFSQFLGIGGFGSVYKGSLGDGTLVAVKKLERFLPHGEKEFITEVNTIGSMHHLNLVRLCGFCSAGSHRLLVYEFMRNGSLDKWIFPSSKTQGRLLDWKTRFSIAIGTAQGIAYFHEQCRNRIIHCDIKPENILLDENFCPKVSDFGLAKLMGREHSQVVTMIRGTRGYLAPEWVSNRPITVKADVYSYGMLLLEMIGGRRNVDMSLGAEDFFYPGWAYKEMSNGTPKNALDKRLRGEIDEEELVRAINVALWCIQDEIWKRPSMGEVVKMLEGSTEVKTPPMPQAVLELVEEGLDHVYRAMKREFTDDRSFTTNSLLLDQGLEHYDKAMKREATQQSSFTIICRPSSQATCSYSTMSPR